MRSENFEIRETPGNKTGNLPGHCDIFLKGSDDSIITIWAGRDMAEECVAFLEEYPARAAAKKAAGAA